jgi:hypothetical protein
MQPIQGELVIMLTSEEVEALKRALASLLSKTMAGDTKTLNVIQEKLKAAQAKML